MTQVTQLTKMLDTLLEGEVEDPDLLESCFLEALYCSLGAALLDDGRARFDECVKRLASLPTADAEGVWASPGQLPGGNRAPPVPRPGGRDRASPRARAAARVSLCPRRALWA